MGGEGGRKAGRQIVSTTMELKIFLVRHTQAQQSKERISLITSTTSKTSKHQISLKASRGNLHVLDRIIKRSKVFILTRLST